MNPEERAAMLAALRRMRVGQQMPANDNMDVQVTSQPLEAQGGRSNVQGGGYGAEEIERRRMRGAATPR